MLPQTRCGHCYPCRIGRSNVCVNLRLVGVHLDGGLQERLDIAAGSAFPTADMDPGTAAFAEPMSIAVHALRRAKLVLLHSSGKFRAPFYWAPFQMYAGL